MMWLIQLIGDWALSARTLNLAFAGLCVLAALGLCPRRVAAISALLYLALACL